MFASGNVWDYWRVFLTGLGLTVLLGLLAMIAGLVFGSLLGLCRCYGPPWLRTLCKVFTETFRSIPPLLLFFGAFFGLSYATGLSLTPFQAALVAMTLEASALMSEVVRAAFQTVTREQWDAAAALGLRFRQALLLVAAPQAVRIMVPPTVNVLVAILKDSSLASIVGLVELTRAGMLVRETTGDSLTVFGLLAVTYFVLNFSLSLVATRLDRRSGAA